MRVLVTGGFGYIGSHLCVALLEEGHSVMILDNESNSDRIVCDAMYKITGKRPEWMSGDVRSEHHVSDALRGVDAVFHLAGLKSVPKSVENPLSYYDNNVHGTGVLLRMMQRHDVKRLIFSSSASVYGDTPAPFTEDSPTAPTNPYAQSKLMCEHLMRDTSRADDSVSMVALRYFNPCGAHPSGFMGEASKVAENLMGVIEQIAVGRRSTLNVYGDDYDTHDGTGLRDYIHVCDLIEAHMKALEYTRQHRGYEVFNIGTGYPHSVHDVRKAYERACKLVISYRVLPRRDGDTHMSYTLTNKAQEQLGYRTTRSLYDCCVDSWRWRSRNRDGYQTLPHDPYHKLKMTRGSVM